MSPAFQRATETSRAAHGAATRDGTITRSQLSVLRALREFGPATARELTRAAGLPDQSQKRLSELVEAGAAVRAGERPCKETGRVATVWAIKTLSTALVPPPRRLAPVEVTGVLSGEISSPPSSRVSQKETLGAPVSGGKLHADLVLDYTGAVPTRYYR